MPEETSVQFEQPTESKYFDWPKIVLAVVLGFALLAVATCAGYWCGTQQTPTPTPTSPTPSPTADWDTYRKEGIAFTFKYPKGATLWGREEDVIQLSLWGPTQKSGAEFHDGLSLRFYLPKAFDNESLRDYVGVVRDGYAAGEFIAEISEVEEVTLNRLGGYTFSTKYFGNQGAKHIYLQSTHQPDVFVEIVDATRDPTDQGFEEIADQILSTFEFLD